MGRGGRETECLLRMAEGKHFFGLKFGRKNTHIHKQRH